MAKVKAIHGVHVILCPGCGEKHTIDKRWTFNGSVDAPTFTPSLLIRSGHYARQFVPGKDSCWCTYNAENPDDPAPFSCGVCHSFITDGRIQFLADCTHKLAGQTVDLPILEDVGED